MLPTWNFKNLKRNRKLVTLSKSVSSYDFKGLAVWHGLPVSTINRLPSDTLHVVLDRLLAEPGLRELVEILSSPLALTDKQKAGPLGVHVIHEPSNVLHLEQSRI